MADFCFFSPHLSALLVNAPRPCLKPESRPAAAPWKWHLEKCGFVRCPPVRFARSWQIFSSSVDTCNRGDPSCVALSNAQPPPQTGASLPHWAIWKCHTELHILIKLQLAEAEAKLLSAESVQLLFSIITKRREKGGKKKKKKIREKVYFLILNRSWYAW